MIKTDNKFLNSNKNFSEDEFYLQSNYQAGNIVLSIYCVTFFLLALFHSFLEHPISILINVIALSISLTGILILRFVDKKYFYYLAHTLYIIYLLLILYAFYIRGIEYPIAGWMLILIMAIFFVFNNQKIVFRYMFLFFLFFFIMVISTKTYLNFEYMLDFMSAILVGSINIYLYNYRSNIIYQKLKDVNDNLENKIKIATLEKTKSLEQEKQKLIYANRHDQLTGLPNIVFFEKELSEIVKEKNNSFFALVYIDINRFKSINELYGHATGDEVLRILGKRFKEQKYSSEVIASVGGDVFLVLLPINDKKDIEKRIMQYKELIEKPIVFDTIEISINASIGVSIYPDHTQNTSELISYANKAMMQSKQSKNNFFMIYMQYIDGLDYSKLQLEREIKNALYKKQFIIYYQPQMNMIDKSIVGLEALVRWDHPKLGILEPKYFLELIQNIGLMSQFEYYFIKEVMLTTVTLHEKYGYLHKLSINLNVHMLEKRDFMMMIKTYLYETGCKGEWIEFEILETEMILDIEQMSKRFDELKVLGITIAIDDFGTGYSSLSYLKSLNIDKVKIDKIFVNDLCNNDENITIIKAIIAIAESFNFDIVVEGVERIEQVNLLLEHHVKVVQGFYYYKPMAFDALIKSL